jgi:hypothetical protein
MTDTDLILFAGAILDHGRYLRAFNTRLNWFTMEMSGLYAAGALFPEFKEATDWRSFAANHLAEEARQQILPDGAQAELSTSYQNVALGNILKVAEIARWTGRTGELPAGYSAPLEKGYEWQLNLMAPDRTTPRINDAGINNLPAIFAHSAVENFPKRADFKWVASGGAEGKGPDYTSIYLNRSGLAVMRSGWDRNANYLMYRLGPLGMGHMHQDKLNLIVYTYGREMIFDSGGGSYEHSKWMDWRKTASPVPTTSGTMPTSSARAPSTRAGNQTRSSTLLAANTRRATARNVCGRLRSIAMSSSSSRIFTSSPTACAPTTPRRIRMKRAGNYCPRTQSSIQSRTFLRPPTQARQTSRSCHC